MEKFITANKSRLFFCNTLFNPFHEFSIHPFPILFSPLLSLMDGWDFGEIKENEKVRVIQ